MMLTLKYYTVLLVFSFIITGCGPSSPMIGVKEDFWREKNITIGVVENIPVRGVANAANVNLGFGIMDQIVTRKLAGNIEKLPVAKNTNTADEITHYLKGRGYRVKRINEKININKLPKSKLKNNDKEKLYYSKFDFRPFKNKWKVDKIVFLAKRTGMLHTHKNRTLEGYGVIGCLIVNLNTNQLEWNTMYYSTKPTTKKFMKLMLKGEIHPIFRTAMRSAHRDVHNKVLKAFKESNPIK